ncbi:MAG: HAMP domain-containing sensor histidine kinase, partial [Pseudomonadota bacterium]
AKEHQGMGPVYNLLERKAELDHLLGQIFTIADLIRVLLTLKIFEGHQSCQILLHQKGSTISENYTYEGEGGLNYSTLSAKDFNRLYNTVKKSKSKLFNRSKMFPESIFWATFLAKEIDLKNHHVVFIISRNDFLPPTKKEQDYFDHIALLLTPIFEGLLAQQQKVTKGVNLKLCLEYFPHPLAILDENDIPVFSNDLPKIGPGLEVANHLDPPILLKNDCKLSISPHGTDGLVSDIYHFQRISLLGELLNTLRHELCNPLFGLKLGADLLAEEFQNGEYADIFQEISTNGFRCQSIIKNFSLLYDDKNNYTLVNLKNLIDEIVTLTKSETRQIRKEIIFMPEDPSFSWAAELNPTWLTQILFNLIINSAQAIKTNSSSFADQKIIVTINATLPQDLAIIVSDTGPGIEQKNISQIFLPFFTTKPHGTGLGLSICKSLAKKMEGRIEFKNNFPSPGVSFALLLPRGLLKDDGPIAT